MGPEPEYDVIPDEPEILPAEELIEPSTLDHLARWAAGQDPTEVAEFLQQAAFGRLPYPAGPAVDEVVNESRAFGEGALEELSLELAAALGTVAEQVGLAGYVLGRSALATYGDELPDYDSEITWDIVARLDWADLMERVGPWGSSLVDLLLAEIELTPTENDDLEGVALLAFAQGFAYAVVEHEYVEDLG